jgi:hypothetical protein
LSGLAREKLFHHILRTLRYSELTLPFRSETEPRYIARVFVPAVRDLLSEFRELRVEGEGVARARSARFLGLPFYPDLSIMLESERLVAFEAKYILASPGAAQNAVACALGQSLIYRMEGYRFTGAILLVYSQVASKELLDSLQHASRLGIDLVVRLIRRGGLAPHPIEVADDS